LYSSALFEHIECKYELGDKNESKMQFIELGFSKKATILFLNGVIGGLGNLNPDIANFT
jgi:hypothetical protein